MTEPEWLLCADPRRMLDFLRGKVSNRKLWLFTAAAGRRAGGLLPDEVNQALAGLGERLADGDASRAGLQSVWEAILAWKERFVADQDFERAAYLRDFQYVLSGGPGLSYPAW